MNSAVMYALSATSSQLMLKRSQIETYLSMPLVNHPGTRWEYGINIDWAGIAVERVSKLSLDAYFKQYIFTPLGISNISFAPNADMLANLVTMSQKLPDGTAEDADHLCRRAIQHAKNEDKSIFHAGGAGCFANPAEYCRILGALLNDGVSPTTDSRILSEESIKEMFTNQIGHFPHFGRQGIAAAKPWATNPIPDVHPQPGDPDQGWGLTFMLTEQEGGRGRNTAHWAGIINSYWWCDREKGVAGFIAGQQLPFASPDVVGAWLECEKIIYETLKD
jgi:CubicO group peptidase (beta-lactamase class C family)